MQTYKAFELEHRAVLDTLDAVILGIFIFEVVIKIVAQGRQPQNYFKDAWNIFDFSIVAVCLLPIQSNDFVAVLRLVRVLRVLKLVSAIPRLQVLVGAVLKSIPSIGYVSCWPRCIFTSTAAWPRFFTPKTTRCTFATCRPQCCRFSGR